MNHESERGRTWRTADGRSIAVKDMENSHLVNVINWILDNPESYPLTSLNRMIDEANYRKTLLFAKGEPYPQLVGKRWRLIDPVTGEGTIVKPPQEYIEAVKGNAAYQTMSKRTQAKRRNETT
jgi:hypothetical protein